MDLGEAESLDLLMRGEIDGYTTVFSFGSDQKIVPISRVGASDYYYAVPFSGSAGMNLPR